MVMQGDKGKSVEFDRRVVVEGIEHLGGHVFSKIPRVKI
jgi:hypothetical protein